MGIARATYYDAALASVDDTAIVEAISAICDEFECYGWRRVRAELRHRGMVVKHKKIRHLMREHGLQPKIRRRHIATTDSDHNQPVYPNRAKDVTLDRPNRPWVADISVPQQAAREMGVGPRDRLAGAVANHRKRRWSKARVESVTEKAP